MQDMVSVIIPVYKAQMTLKRCIDSLLDNHYENLEIILVEDRSPDGSWELCQTYAGAYEHITAVQNEENLGVSKTRNRGLSLACGTYILFVDSDDWVESTYVSSLTEAVRCHSARLAIAGYVNHDEVHNGRTDTFVWEEGGEAEAFCTKLKDLYEKRLLQQLWNKIFLREIIEEHQIRFDPAMNVGEDFRFVLTYIAAMGKDKAVFLNVPVYHYIRDNSESLMSKVGYERIEESWKNMEMMYRLMGLEDRELNSIMTLEKRKQREVSAYIILHNEAIDRKEKKRLIQNLAGKDGGKLFRRQRLLYWKEKAAEFLKK